MSERDYVICQECGAQLPSYAVKHDIDDCCDYHMKRVKEISGIDIAQLRDRAEQAEAEAGALRAALESVYPLIAGRVIQLIKAHEDRAADEWNADELQKSALSTWGNTLDMLFTEMRDRDYRIAELEAQPVPTPELESFIDGCLRFLPRMEWVMSTYRAAVARPDSTAPRWLGELVSLYDRLMEQGKNLYPEQAIEGEKEGVA